MKNLLALVFIFLTNLLFSQIPSTYYNSANGLSGYALKSQLKTIITNGHNNRGYDALYEGYKTTDTDHYYENDGTVLDIYSEKPSGVDAYNYSHTSGSDRCGQYNTEADCYNREHIIPQSVFSEASPMVSDIHSVVPSDGYVNGKRSNHPFGVVSNPTWTSTNGSKLGSCTFPGYSGTSFEPIDEFKGDVARMLFYFATRYETQVDSWSFPMFNDTENQVFTDWALNMLIEWHNNDPVTQREIDRNNAAYNFQGNANPFISHPEWVNAIWNPSTDTEVPSVPTNLVASNETANTITLSWTASTDNAGVSGYDIYKDAVLLASSSTNSYLVNGLSPLTTYTFYVKAKDAAGNVSNASNSVQATTTDVPASSSNELFFSEYVEGSSYNKALEIANKTGSSVDLSSYSIARNVNGAGGWDTSYTLSGSITNGDVFVIAHSQADAAILAQKDFTSDNITSYNGNDPVGLFKNGVLIDIIGVLDGGATDFAKDVTIRRKQSIVSPNTTFNLAAEWDSFPSNTFDGLGNHSTLTNGNELSITYFSVYPNPSKGIINIDSNEFESSYVVLDVLGNIVIQAKLHSNKINLNDLNNGIYFLIISNENGLKTAKFIIEK